VSYPEHRVRRLWAAQEYEGHDLPPYPHEGDGKLIGRVVMFPEFLTNLQITAPAGFYHRFKGGVQFHYLEAHYKAKEKRQNRQFYEKKPR
jgi:hypothetical protein